ncbi:MAG: type II toxin-antitoxin system Phd/YefM family antitoxin [Terriglobales bacterium]
MKTFNIHHAKTHLSRLIEEAVSKGEPFVIAKAGKPMVKVERLEPPAAELPQFGFMRGMFTVPDDFDTMMEKEIEEMFYGGDDLEPYREAAGPRSRLVKGGLSSRTSPRKPTGARGRERRRRSRTTARANQGGE